MYKIMFVDDEEQNLFLMEKIIDWEENGFRVCGIALIIRRESRYLKK